MTECPDRDLLYRLATRERDLEWLDYQFARLADQRKHLWQHAEVCRADLRLDDLQRRIVMQSISDTNERMNTFEKMLRTMREQLLGIGA